MQTFHAEKVIEKNGELRLDHLPFPEGAAVHVFVSSAETVSASISLKGTLLKYERPFDSVASEDWEAAN